MDFRIYSRKSVYTGKGESIENQVEMCKAYIFSNFAGATEADITVYEDEGFSGKSLDRPQFQQMMKDIKKHKPDCIVCYRLDRISRNVGDFASLIESLNDRDIAFVCIKEKFDTSTPMGKAMMYIASVFAQLERETIAERVRDNMLMLAKMGRWLGGQTPTGYSSEKVQEVIIDGKMKTSCKLKVNEEEMGIVRLIYQKMIAFHSVNGVRKYLASQNIKSRTGKDFSLLGIKEILQNPVYCIADEAARAYFVERDAVVCFDQEDCKDGRGLLSYNKRDYTKGHAPRQSIDKWIIAVGKHKGQIPGTEWVSIQRLFEENKTDGSKPPVMHNDYSLLSGMIYCAKCGSRMFAKRRSNNPKVFDYICSDKMQLNRCDCPNLNGPQMDDMVCEYLMNYENQNSELCQRLEKLKRTIKSDTGEDPRERLEKRIQACDQEINRLVDMLAGEDMNPAVVKRLNDKAAVLDAEMQELVRAKKELGTGLDAGEERSIQLDMLVRALAVFKENFASASVYEKRTLIRLIVQKCEWNGRDFDIFIYGE